VIQEDLSYRGAVFSHRSDRAILNHNQHSPMKSKYQEPTLTDYGPVHSLTGALGSADREDQSEFPNEFPPDGGSKDVCGNESSDIC
jgi:hypothetical protein